MELPKVDQRNKNEILEEFFRLAKSYVPQWKATEKQDAGVALADIFAEQLLDSIKRLNDVPYKNLIYYLNLLGGQMLPATSASGYITVKLNEGTPNGVPIPKGTVVYGQSDTNERVVFETENEILAVDNEIEDIFCKSGCGTKLIQSYQKGQETSVRFFDFYGSPNLHCHKLYLDGGDALLIGEEAEIYITFENKQKKNMGEMVATFLAKEENAGWYFLYEGVEYPLTVLHTAGNSIVISGMEIPVSECMGVEGRWLVCNILDETVKTELSVTAIYVSSEMSGVQGGYFYSNDIPLTNEDFLPFQERFSTYDAFYINCDEVLGKRGANVSITMTLDSILTEAERVLQPQIKWKAILKEVDLKEPEKYDITVDTVLWEYWNGISWCRLFENHMYEDIFQEAESRTVTMRFCCPEDMEASWVGPGYGYWIRARIVSSNHLWTYNIRYRAPRIQKIGFSYYYTEEKRPKAMKIVEEKDRAFRRYGGEQQEPIVLCSVGQKEYPCAYFRLKHSMKGGPIKIFFQKEGAEQGNMPSLKWQYWGNLHGTSRWLELKIADETASFGKSGMISFICSNGLKKVTLFGEEGYWLRVVNMDGFYDKEQKCDLPTCSGIYLNMVKVIQRETVESEYFYTLETKPNMIFDLSREHVIEVEVWVNEEKELIGKERYSNQHLQKEDVYIEADENGLITQYWVKWKREKSLYALGREQRAYVLEEKEGKICFGDGIHGKIPPSTEGEGIRVDYKVTAGESGNFLPFQIDGFADAVPFVSQATNLESISGGCEDESIVKAIERCMKTVSHQNRAVSAEDYSILVKEADRNIVDVKVIFSAEDTVKIAILPRQMLSGSHYFEEMKHKVQRYLLDKVPVTLYREGGVEVFEAEYIEYCIHIKLTIESYDEYHDTYKSIEELLGQYLNPINGNYHQKGFSMGNLPTKIKIYNYLKNISTIQNIESLTIFCYERIQKVRKEIDYDSIFEKPFAVPINGVHEIDIEIATN